MSTKSAAQEITDRIYRVIRACPDSFSINEVASLAECGISKTRDTLWLFERLGYVREVGRQGYVKMWRLTPLGRNSTTAPEIPKNREDFTEERRALARVVEIFMVRELSHWRVVEMVKAQLEILNRRFGVNGKEGE